MWPLPRATRIGYSLAELMVAMTVIGLLGVAFTRLLVTQGRFADQQNALRSARGVARQGMNVMMSELRMVQDSGGIDSAATDGKAIRVLVPYRFGLNCGVSLGKSVVSMLPVDSLVLAQAVYAGYAWRSQAGRYTVVYPGSPLGADAPVASADDQQCRGSNLGQAQIRRVSVAGRSGLELDITPPEPSAPQGQAVFFFQRITYSFAPSSAFPGQYGLWRSAQGGASEELVAPFDSTARFRYWSGTAATAVASPPALAEIRGVDVEFAGKSTYAPAGRVSPAKSTVIASIFFKNVRAY